MFGFIKSYYPTLHKKFSELENSRKVYFDNKNTWNTILIHNVNLAPHYEHLLIVEIEQHVGKIKNIQSNRTRMYKEERYNRYLYKGQYFISRLDIIKKHLKY